MFHFDSYEINKEVFNCLISLVHINIGFRFSTSRAFSRFRGCPSNACQQLSTIHVVTAITMKMMKSVYLKATMSARGFFRAFLISAANKKKNKSSLIRLLSK